MLSLKLRSRLSKFLRRAEAAAAFLPRRAAIKTGTPSFGCRFGSVLILGSLANISIAFVGLSLSTRRSGQQPSPSSAFGLAPAFKRILPIIHSFESIFHPTAQCKAFRFFFSSMIVSIGNPG